MKATTIVLAKPACYRVAERRQSQREYAGLRCAERNALRGGNTWNVLPESVELEGTLRIARKFNRTSKRASGEIAAGFASAFSLRDITVCGPTALVNDEHWAAFATSVAREAGMKRNMPSCIWAEGFCSLSADPRRLSALAAIASMVLSTRPLIGRSIN